MFRSVNYFASRCISLQAKAWKRPENIPYPSVWATFEGKPFGDQKPIKYKIQDLTESHVEKAIEHMTRYFLARESTCSTSGFAEEEVSVTEIQTVWRQILKQRLGLICLAIDPETGAENLAAVSMSCVSEKDEEKPTFKGMQMNKMWTCILDLQKDIDVFKKYNTDVYMSGLGLNVAPHYHGDNIGYHMLMARTPLCIAAGIPVTVTGFSGPASQYLGKKCGFYKITELKYKEYKQNGKVAYPRLKYNILLMGKEISESM